MVGGLIVPALISDGYFSMKKGSGCPKGVDLFHAKILFYICTGANGF